MMFDFIFYMPIYGFNNKRLVFLITHFLPEDSSKKFHTHQFHLDSLGCGHTLLHKLCSTIILEPSSLVVFLCLVSNSSTSFVVQNHSWQDIFLEYNTL